MMQGKQERGRESAPAGASDCWREAPQSEDVASRARCGASAGEGRRGSARRNRDYGEKGDNADLHVARFPRRRAWDYRERFSILGIFESPNNRRWLPEIPGRHCRRRPQGVERRVSALSGWTGRWGPSRTGRRRRNCGPGLGLRQARIVLACQVAWDSTHRHEPRRWKPRQFPGRTGIPGRRCGSCPPRACGAPEFPESPASQSFRTWPGHEESMLRSAVFPTLRLPRGLSHACRPRCSR